MMRHEMQLAVLLDLHRAAQPCSCHAAVDAVTIVAGQPLRTGVLGVRAHGLTWGCLTCARAAGMACTRAADATWAS